MATSCACLLISKLHTIELSVKSLKKGPNRGFDPSLRKVSIKSSLAHHVLELIVKVGWNFCRDP